MKETVILSISKVNVILKERLGLRSHIRTIRDALKKLNLILLLKQFGILCGKVLLYIHGTFFLVVLIISVLYTHVNPPVTSLMLYRRLFNDYRPSTVSYVPLEQIPKDLQRMVVKVEDYKFYTHSGIDVHALFNAFELNRRLGTVRYGGSTISMQVARTLFLVPKQSYIRKYLEILIALEMDLVMKKSRILELYLNYCEWGRGVYGIGAAASHHYHKKVQELSTDERRRIVTILASPLRYTVDNFDSRKSLRKRYDFLVRHFP